MSAAAATKAPGRRTLGYIALSVLGACVGLLFLIPLWWTFVNSLRPGGDTFRYLNPLQWETRPKWLMKVANKDW